MSDDGEDLSLLALAGAAALVYFTWKPSSVQHAGTVSTDPVQGLLDWIDRTAGQWFGSGSTPVQALPGIVQGGTLVPVQTPSGTIWQPAPAGGGGAPVVGGTIWQPAGGGTDGGFALSDNMLAKLSQKTVTEVLKLFQDPPNTFQLSPEAAQEWQAYRIGERADFTAWANQTAQLPTIDPAEFTLTLGDSFGIAGESPSLVASDLGLSLVDTTLDAGVTPAEALSIVDAAGGESIALTGSLLNIGTVLTAVAVVGLVVDMGFTIASNKPDAQKAVDTALDAVMIACLFIPVYGWIIAIVIALVKALLDFFGADIFGGGLSHAQREAQERARYGQLLAPMLGDIGHAYAPREMVRVLADWYHGAHPVSMAVGFYNVNVPGQNMTFAAPGDPSNSSGVGMPYSWDDMAYYLVWGPADQLWAAAQVGIAANLKLVFEDAVLTDLRKKRPVWQSLMAQGADLAGLDVVADELRLKPDLTALAGWYGVASWQDLVAPDLQPAWSAWYPAHPQSTVNTFARAYGYPDLRSWRNAILQARYWPRFLQSRHVAALATELLDRATAVRLQWAYQASYGPAPTG